MIKIRLVNMKKGREEKKAKCISGRNSILPRVLVFDVLNSASALDTADSKSRRVVKASDHTCLPLERTLECLVDLRWVPHINDIDVPVRGADYA